MTKAVRLFLKDGVVHRGNDLKLRYLLAEKFSEKTLSNATTTHEAGCPYVAYLRREREFVLCSCAAKIEVAGQIYQYENGVVKLWQQN